jgi:hypothetical protein
MRRPAFVFVLSLLILAGASALPAQDQPQWKPFSSEAGNFRVLVPGVPKETATPIRTDGGDVVEHRFTVDMGFIGYFVSYTDYPSNFQDVQAAIDHVRDGFLGGIKGKVVNEGPVRLSGNLGRAVKAETDDGKLVALLRIYIVGRRLYQVLLMTDKTRNLSTMDLRFHDSFQFLRP